MAGRPAKIVAAALGACQEVHQEVHLRAASLVADPEEPLVSDLAADLEARLAADTRPAFVRDDAGNLLAERARCADARWRCATGRVFRGTLMVEIEQ